MSLEAIEWLITEFENRFVSEIDHIWTSTNGAKLAPLNLRYYTEHEQWAVDKQGVLIEEVEEWDHPSGGNTSMITIRG